MSRIVELDFTIVAVNLMILSHMGVFLFLTLKSGNTENHCVYTKSNKIFNSIGVFAHLVFFFYLLSKYGNVIKTLKKIHDENEVKNM